MFVVHESHLLVSVLFIIIKKPRLAFSREKSFSCRATMKLWRRKELDKRGVTASQKRTQRQMVSLCGDNTGSSVCLISASSCVKRAHALLPVQPFFSQNHIHELQDDVTWIRSGTL